VHDRVVPQLAGHHVRFGGVTIDRYGEPGPGQGIRDVSGGEVLDDDLTGGAQDVLGVGHDSSSCSAPPRRWSRKARRVAVAIAGLYDGATTTVRLPYGGTATSCSPLGNRLTSAIAEAAAERTSPPVIS
jgi:hypothetical protein